MSLAMLAAAPHELQPFPGFPLPLACVKGMKESIKSVVSTEVRRTIRGESVALPGPWKPKSGFKLSNSGPGVLVPPEDYLPIGEQIAFNSSRPHLRIAQGGASVVTVGRLIVPGSVHAVDGDGRPIIAEIGPDPFSIRIPSAPVLAFAHFRLTYHCVIAGLSEITTDFTGRDTGWTLDLEEQYAP